MLPPSLAPMTVLQNKWYNCLTTELHLDPKLFQIQQPAVPLSHSDQALWADQDALPSLSLTFNRSLDNGSRFSDEYAAVVSQLQYPISTFQQDIGEDVYQKWLAYLEQMNSTATPQQLPALFRKWSILNAPSVASQGVSALSKMALISTAQQGLLSYQGANAKPIDFAGTFAQLLQALAVSPGKKVLFDSSAAEGDVTKTWAEGNHIGLSGLWSGSSSTARLSQRFALSKVTVSLQFKAYTVWTSTPGAWYNSSLLNSVYSAQTTPPWSTNPTWAEIFSPQGSIQRCIASIVVVDGVAATITSDSRFCKVDQQTIQRNAANGLWPFYSATKAGTVTNGVTFDDAKGMQIEVAIQPGNPIVLGNNVLGLAQYLGHGV